MKKPVLFAAMCAVCMCVYAQNTDTDLYYQGFAYKDTRCIVTGNAVNVRSGAGSGYAKLFQLNAGDVVSVMEKCDAPPLLADGALSYWYKITCGKGTGFMCGRWLTSKYAAGDINADGKIDYITYQAFYRIPYGAEDFDEYIFTNDTFLLIQGGTVSELKGLSFIPKEKGHPYRPRDIAVIADLELPIKNPVILFSNFFGYGSGRSCICDFYFFNEDNTFSPIISAGSVWEGYYYKKTKLIFPNKAYDVYNQKWSDSEKGRKDIIIKITKDGKENDTYETESETVSQAEYRWNGASFEQVR